MNILGNAFLPHIHSGAGAVEFVPDLDGCMLWLDANDGSRMFIDSGYTNVSTDGQAVALYLDKSLDEVAVTTDPGTEPTYKTLIRNGHSVIRFDGVDDSMGISLGQAPGDLTVFIAVDILGQSGATLKYLFDVENGRLVLAALGDSPGDIQYYDGAWSSPAAATMGWQVLTFHLASTGATIYRNGSPIVTSSYTQKGLFGSSRIGSNFVPDGSYLAMDLGEMMIYNQALSTGAREAIEEYLMTKWGL